MSWCDKLAATPAVGFKFDPQFASSDALYDALQPILNQLVKNDKPRFTIENQDSFSVGFGTDEGFSYTVDPFKASVTFKHRMVAKSIDGGPPRMELTSVAMPFTELLPRTTEKLIEATLLLPNAKRRFINRVGVIATTGVAEENLPPGIMKFVSYMSRPWQDGVDSYQMQIVGRLRETDTHADRCIYQLIKSDDPDQIMKVTFDWQRSFKKPQPIDPKILNDVTKNAERSALEYFEEIAEGSQWDESIIDGKSA